MDNKNIPEHIQYILNLDNIDSCQSYIRVMTDYLFDLLFTLKDKQGASYLIDESTVFVQMMFTNTLAYSKLLEGVYYVRDNKFFKRIIDHRMLFTLGRTMYECLLAFELIFIIPSNDDDKQLIYSLYKAKGLKEQLDLLSKNVSNTCNETFNELKKVYDEVVEEVNSTEYYQQANNTTKKMIDNALRAGKYRYLIQSDKSLKKVEWSEGIKLMGIESDAFDGMYKLFSNLSHPTYLGQLQYEMSFDSEQPEYIFLSCYATMWILSFQSFFIADLIKIYPEAKEIFDKQSTEDQLLIEFYNHQYRKSYHKK